jgi:hypothetical protein
MPIIDSTKLLFESEIIHDVTPWHKNEVDYTPDENDIPNIDLKDRWIDFRKWSTVRAEYFCNEGTTAYFEIVLERYSGCSAPQFGFCTSEFEKQTFGRFGTHVGVGDDDKSWGIDGERCLLWSGGKSESYERFVEWDEDDVLGFVCDMKSEPSQKNIATCGGVAQSHANIYVFVNGRPIPSIKNGPVGLAFKIPKPVQEEKDEGLKSQDEFRLWPAFTARGMRLGYNFGPQFRFLEETKSKLSSSGIKISKFYFSGEGQQKSASHLLQLPLVKLEPKQADGFSEDTLWRSVMGQAPPPTYKVQNELSNYQLSQAVNMLLIKSQLDAVQTATSILVLKNRVHVLKQKVENQERELEEKKYLDLIDALVDVPFIGMLTISFTMPRKNNIQRIFKLFPFTIFGVQWILLVTVGNFSLSKYQKSGGEWCLNNATPESRALMSAIAALILAKNAQRLVGLMESTSDDSDDSIEEPASGVSKNPDSKETAIGKEKKRQVALKGFTKLIKLISNTDGISRLVIFFIIDMGMEICFASAVLLVNLFIVFVAEEPLDMVLNCLALEFIADIDNQMKDYLFRSWTEKDALLSSFEYTISQSLDDNSWWDSFTKQWVGEDDLKWWFVAISLCLAFFGVLFSFVFAPLATMAMIIFGPICKPGSL